MRKSVYLVTILVMVCMLTNSADALDKTSTGFYYPIGESNFDQANGGWLYGLPGYPQYGDGKQGVYHVGVDMMTRETDPSNENSRVYSIAYGKVIYVHQSSDWGTTNGVNNVMVFIQHQTKSGTYFIGYYGHLQAQLADGVAKDETVVAGQLIGYTGDYLTSESGAHLHFGIRKGTSINPSPWGRIPDTQANQEAVDPVTGAKPFTNGFIDPIAFIRNNYPGPIAYRRVGNVAWYPPNSSCLFAERWIFFSGGYPNGAQSIGMNTICQQEEYEMVMALGGYGNSDWYLIIYGTENLDQVLTCHQ